MGDDRVVRLDRQLARLHAMFARSLHRFEAAPSDAELDYARLVQQVIGEVEADMERAIEEVLKPGSGR